MATDAHYSVLFIHTRVCIPEYLLRWNNRAGRIKSKPIWADGNPLSPIAGYQPQWLDVKYVDECYVLCLLIRERLLDSKLRTTLPPTKSVRLAVVLPAPCRSSIALIYHDCGC